MSIPSAVFLDTSVVEAQRYNFSSLVLSAFASACQQHSVTVLLPDPIEKEMRRHIKKRTADALGKFDAALEDAPFLRKWPGCPPSVRSVQERQTIERLGLTEMTEFFQSVRTVRLGYKGVEVETIMWRYDNSLPPFREGKKSKEFPDAIAVAMLELYIRQNNCQVAVISGDDDFRRACEHQPSLLHFRSLRAFTELLVSSERNAGLVRAALGAATDKIADAVDGELSWLGFDTETVSARVTDTSFDKPTIGSVSLLALGDSECTIAFDGEVAVGHTVEYIDIDWEGSETVEREREEETVPLSGTAKVQLSKDLTSVVDASVSLDFVTATYHPRRLSRW